MLMLIIYFLLLLLFVMTIVFICCGSIDSIYNSIRSFNKNISNSLRRWNKNTHASPVQESIIFFIIIVGVTSLSLLAVFKGCYSTSDIQTSREFDVASTSSHTTGYRLAVIDGNYGVTEQAAIVQEYNSVLEYLANKMNTTKGDIADAAVAVQNRLEEGYNIEVSLKSIIGNACLLADSYNDVTHLFVAVLNEYKY